MTLLNPLKRVPSKLINGDTLPNYIWQQGLECSIDLLSRYNKVCMVIYIAGLTNIYFIKTDIVNYYMEKSYQLK